MSTFFSKRPHKPELQRLADSSEFSDHKLVKRGKAIDVKITKTQVTDAVIGSIRTRFQGETVEFEPTMIASLKNWPPKN